MSIISTSLTVPGQPSPRFHVEAWLPFRNHEVDYIEGGMGDQSPSPLDYQTTKCYEITQIGNS